MPLKIAIIGAGPAGCTLARLLQHNNNSDKSSFDITIFESENAANFRSQGGTLDLHETTGQRAMKKAGLWDQFLKYARYDGEALKIADKNMLCYISMGGGKEGSTTGRPEIDRPQLRQILYESLAEGTVQWGHKVVKIDQNRTIHFTNGQSAGGFDLIVGADGAWSKVRSLLTDVKPYYSGVAGHSLKIPNAAQSFPELEKLVNRGSVFAYSDERSIMAQYMSDGSLNIGTWAKRPETWQTTCGFDVKDPKAVREMYKQEFQGWDERLIQLTQVAEDSSIVPRDLYMLPVGASWQHQSGVTLIGDAAHLMTPFAGEGVNLALADSLKLSEAILSMEMTDSASSTTALDAAVVSYEQEMFTRAAATQQLTLDNMHSMYFTPGAPRNGIEGYVARSISDELGSWMWLAKPIIHAWFFVFKLLW